MRTFLGLILIALVAPAGAAPDLRQDLLVYAPFDGDLRCWLGNGGVQTAAFSRPTPAVDGKWRVVGRDVPRFAPGRFGTGVYLEPGGSEYRRGVRNHLAPAQADPEKDLSGLEALGGAKLSAGAPSLVGQGSLRVEAAAAGDGFATAPFAAPEVMRYTGSLSLRGTRGGERVRVRIEERKGAIASPAQEVTLTTEWQRVFAQLPVAELQRTAHGADGKERKVEALPEVRLVVEASAGPAAFLADALQIEQAGVHYVNAGSPTSWLPGGVTREHERLSLPVSRQTWPVAEGTVAFWVRPDDFAGCRSYLSVGANHFFPWGVRISHRGFEFGARDSWHAIRDGAKAFPPETWTHLALTWDAAQVRLFADGKPVAEGPIAPGFDEKRLYESHTTLGIGGHANPGWSPNTFAKAALDEFLILKRALAADEVAALAAGTTPLPLRPALGVEMRLAARVFGRERAKAEIPFRFTNDGAAPMKAAKAVLTVGPAPAVARPLPPIPAGQSVEVAFPISPAHLRAGAYPLKLQVDAPGGKPQSVTDEIRIGPCKPWDRLPVMAWRYGGDRELARTLAEHGVTVGGTTSGFGTDANALARLWSMWDYHHQGQADPADPTQFIVGLRGQRTAAARLSHPSVRERAVADAGKTGEMLRALPDVRYAIINTEWDSALDFSPASRDLVKRQFGLDLEAWMQSKLPDWNTYFPFERLGPALDEGRWVPKEGIVRAGNGLYNYTLWWHRTQGVAAHNEALTAALKKARPDLVAIQEPILRRPPVRVFSQMDVAEEWVYYPEPTNMVPVQEGLNAICRGTKMRPSGMPQFLFKPGMAAPFGATPTPDLLREAVWLCCAQPIRWMMFWNFGAALSQSDQWDLAAVEKEFKGLTWEQGAARLKELAAQKKSVHLWHPGTAPEFQRLARTLWEPYGPLIRRWENRPRRLAVLNSLAASVFSGERWYNHRWLGEVIQSAGIPFDVIYDQEFFDNPRRLEGYDVVVAPFAPALPEAAVTQLRAYLAAGGTVVADEWFGPKIEGVARLQQEQAPEAQARLDAEREAARRAAERLQAEGERYDPQTYEKMQASGQDVWRRFGRHQGLAKILQERVRPEVASLTPNVLLNVLRAGGASYAVAVNDLRGPGPYFGQWGKVRELGIPQRARFRARRPLGAVVYDLTAGERVPCRADGEWLEFSRDLAGAGGVILGFFPSEVKSLAASCQPARVAPGGDTRLAVTLSGADGKPLPGVVPARVEVIAPDGKATDLSRYAAIEEGRLALVIPVAYNDPAGTWWVRVREMASGQEGEARFTVGKNS